MMKRNLFSHLKDSGWQKRLIVVGFACPSLERCVKHNQAFASANKVKKYTPAYKRFNFFMCLSGCGGGGGGWLLCDGAFCYTHHIAAAAAMPT
jgi:hypothetical protein